MFRSWEDSSHKLVHSFTALTRWNEINPLSRSWTPQNATFRSYGTNSSKPVVNLLMTVTTIGLGSWCAAVSGLCQMRGSLLISKPAKRAGTWFCCELLEKRLKSSNLINFQQSLRGPAFQRHQSSVKELKVWCGLVEVSHFCYILTFYAWRFIKLSLCFDGNEIKIQSLSVFFPLSVWFNFECKRFSSASYFYSCWQIL